MLPAQRLGDIFVGSGSEGLLPVAVVGECRDRDDRHGGIERADPPRSLEPVHHGHLDVHQDGRRVHFPAYPHRFFAIDGPHDVEFLAEHQRHQQEIAVGILGHEQQREFPVLTGHGMRSLSHNGRFVVRPGIACHGRYGEPEAGAPAFLRLDADMPAHLLDDALRDRKPQPGALRKAVEFDETVENSAQMLFGDAFPRILDVEQQVPGLPAVAQRDGALLGEFHRIVDKIGDDLHQPVLVPDDAALLLTVAEKQFDGPVLHLEAQRTHRLLAHAVDVDHAVIEFERPGLDLRKVEDVGYQFEQQVVVFLDDLHVLAALADFVGFGQQVREPHDGIERRTYLVAHIGQEGRFQAVADLGLVLGFDQALLRLLEFRDIEIDAYHLDLRGVGIQRVAHHVDARPPVLAVAEPDPQVEREAVRLVGLDPPDLPEYSLAVFGVDVVVDADHLRHGGVALLAQVVVPLRHGIPVAGHQVEAGIPHLAEAAHQREGAFELLQPVVGFVDLGIVDIEHQEIDQLAGHAVQHGHLRIYLHAALFAGGIVAAQPVEGVIEPETLLQPVAHVAGDLPGHDRVLEEIDPQHILLRLDAEDVEVFGVDVDQIALFVIKFHPDLDVVENIAQHFFAVEQRLVGIAHFGSIGKEADHLVGPGRIEDGVYPAFRDLVKGVALDEAVAAKHLRKGFQILLHIQPQFGNTPADIGFALGTHDQSSITVAFLKEKTVRCDAHQKSLFCTLKRYEVAIRNSCIV